MDLPSVTALHSFSIIVLSISVALLADTIRRLKRDMAARSAGETPVE